MANIAKFNTRVQLKFDLLENWNKISPLSFKPLKGEVCIVKVPTGSSAEQTTPPAYLMRVGDGETYFENLPWVSALAADVHSWAKKSEDEFAQLLKTGLGSGAVKFVTKEEFDALVARVTAVEGDVAALHAAIDSLGNSFADATGAATKTITGFEYDEDTNEVTPIFSDIEFPPAATVETEVKDSNNAVSAKAVKTYVDAVDSRVTSLNNTIDDETTGLAAAHTKAERANNAIAGMTLPEVVGSDAYTFIKSIKQENGKVTAETGSIPDATTEVKGVVKLGVLGGAAKQEDVNAINSDIEDLTNEIAAVRASATQALHFLGTTTTEIADGEDANKVVIGETEVTPVAGDVVLYGGYEYVYVVTNEGNYWEQFGQEGSFVIQGTKFADADIAANANIAQTKIAGQLAQGNTLATDISSLNSAIGEVAQDLADLAGTVNDLDKTDIGLGNVTNDRQVKAIDSSTVDHIVVFAGTDGATIKDSGKTIAGLEEATAAAAKAASDAQKTADGAVSQAGANATAIADLTGTVGAVSTVANTASENATSALNKITGMDLTQLTGDGVTFVQKIAQNDGVVTAELGTIQEGTDKQAGIVKLGVAGGAATYATVDALSTKVTNLDNALTGTTGIANRLTAVEAKAESNADAIAAMDLTADEIDEGTAGLEFIQSVTQENGKVAAVKATIQTASESQKGVVQLNVTGGAARYDDFSTLSGTVGDLSGAVKNISDIIGTAANPADGTIYDRLDDLDTAVANATIDDAEGSGLTFIQSIKKNSEGKVEAIPGTIREASDTQTGVVYLGKAEDPKSAAKQTDLELLRSDFTDLNNVVIDPVTGLTPTRNRVGAVEDAIAAMDYSAATDSKNYKFIDGITQVDGKITGATFGTIPDATSTVKGIALLGADGGAATYESVANLRSDFTNHTGLFTNNAWKTSNVVTSTDPHAVTASNLTIGTSSIDCIIWDCGGAPI